MQNPSLWSSYAEATELALDGNRLIAQEIAALARNLWQRTVRFCDGLLNSLGQHRQLPPA